MTTFTCQEPGCDQPATQGTSTRLIWCGTHAEERELEFDIAIDASSVCHDDVVQRIAEQAAATALHGFENGDVGDLLLNSSRAALIATGAALRALEDAGHLIPDGATVERHWRARAENGAHLTGDMDADEFESWMKTRGLFDGEYLEVLRTVATAIPREVIKPQPMVYDHTALVGEADF